MIFTSKPQNWFSFFISSSIFLISSIGFVSCNSEESSTPTPENTSAPTMSLNASESIINSGESVTLRWTSSNATECIASNGWSGSRNLSGSESVSNITRTATYILICMGSAGSANSSVTVQVRAGTPVPSGTLNINSSTGNDALSRAEVLAGNGKWRTLKRALWGSTDRANPNCAAAAQAGDTIQVEPGVNGIYTANQNGGASNRNAAFAPCNTGLPGREITIKASAIGNVTLKTSGTGDGPVIGAIFNGETKNYIRWQNFIIDHRDTPSLGAINNSNTDTAVIMNWDGSNNTYEYLTVIGRNQSTARNGSLYSGFRVERGEYCVIRQNKITNIRGQGFSAEAILTYGAPFILIENNTIYDTDNGIGLKDEAEPVISRGEIVRYNKIFNVNRTGLYFIVHPGDINQPAKIYQNVFSNVGSSSGIAISFGGNVAQLLNITSVLNTSPVRINLDADHGLVDGLIITIWGTGLSLDGHAYIIQTPRDANGIPIPNAMLLLNTTASGTATSGIAARRPVSYVEFVNNTVVIDNTVQNDSEVLNMIGHIGQGVVIQNNVVYGNALRYVRTGHRSNTSSWQIDNNCYFGLRNGNRWEFTSPSLTLTTLSSWQTQLGGCPVSGNDCSSQVIDPLFRNAASGDFRLSSTTLGDSSSSQCLGAGIDRLQLLGGSATQSINIGAYITNGQTDQIGAQW